MYIKHVAYIPYTYVNKSSIIPPNGLGGRLWVWIVKNIFTRVREEGIKELIWESLRSWLWPLAVPVITVVLGYAQQLPLMYIFVGAVASFALITHGLVMITEWRFIKTPEHKLDFIEPNIGAIYDKEDPAKANAVYLGIKLLSLYNFPIEVEVSDMKTKIDNRVPKDKSILGRVIKVGMRGVCYFNDDDIDITNLDLKGKEINGSIDFTVNYGIPGKRIYKYKKSIELTFLFDNEGNYQTHSWSDPKNPVAT